VWLGKRSTRIWAGVGRQLIPQAAWTTLVLAACMVIPAPPRAEAQRAAPATVGPARIICNASFCEMGSGARPKERIRIIVSNLPQDEVRRLRKCTGVAKPCIVTIEGTQQGDVMKVMATAIRWQE
jgi:hypothetical protein